MVKHISSLHKELSMRQARVVPGKYVPEDLMFAIKEKEVKLAAISSHMPQNRLAVEYHREKDETPTKMLN